jgi:hypothetical protein
MFHEPANYPPVLEGTMTMSNPYFSKLPYAQAVIDSLRKDPPILYTESSKFSEVENMIGDSVTAVLTGADVKTTLDSLAERMQVILDQK